MASDAEVLQDVGFQFVTKVARLAFEGAFYGIYLILMYFWIAIVRQWKFRDLSTFYLTVITIIMFCGSSLFYAIDIADLVIRLKIILMDNPGMPLEDKANQADFETRSLLWTGEMLFIFMLCLGDSVVVWRTWTIYRGNRKFLIVPLLTWTGSLIAAFYELGCDIHTDWAINDSTPSAASEGAKSCARADTASYSLSFGTNTICTGLIVYKAWWHHKFMSEYLGLSRRKTQAERILTLLVESGSVYLLLYTLQAIPIYGGTTSASFLPWLVVNAIIQQAMGMYPTAIIVLVQMQKSLWAESENNNELGARRPATPTQTDMEFANRTITYDRSTGQSTSLGLTQSTALSTTTEKHAEPQIH